MSDRGRRSLRRVPGACVREPGTRRAARTDGRIVDRRLVEPHGVGFALLIAPSYALGGARAVQGEMLAMLALAFVLARRWRGAWCRSRGRRSASGLVGLSPPAVAASTTITPGIAAAVLLAGAAWCALAIRERPRRGYGPRRPVARGAALAGLVVRGRGRVVAWALVVWTCASGGASRRWSPRDAARLPGVLRHGQRPLLRRHHAPLGRDRRAPDSPLGYVERCRGWSACGWTARRPAALGAADRARVLRGLAAVPLPPRPARARGPGTARGQATAGLLLAVIGAQLVVVAL